MALDLAVLTIGDELLSGELPDTNTGRIARALAGKGWRIGESRTVSDRMTDIAQALITMAGERDAVIVTGGLGPTEDDRTARGVCEAFGLRLAPCEEARSQVHAWFERRSLAMPPANEKQALLPEGARVLENLIGTAPGFELCYGESLFYFLPGVPSEMEPLLHEQVIPRLMRRFPEQKALQERHIRLFGLSEPKVEELLTSRPLPAGIELGFGVDYPVVIVKLRGTDGALLDKMAANVERLLSRFVIGRGEQSLAAYLGELLRQRNLRLALAESCTGGLASALVTGVPGASEYFVGAALSYHNRAKAAWLKVPWDLIENEGAVSAPCALAMALGMLKTSGADIAVSITGIAGPEGGTAEKPVGTLFIALAAKGLDAPRVQRYQFHGDRERIRLMSAYMALDQVRKYLLEV